MLQYLVYNSAIDVEVFMNQYVSETNHPRPPLGKLRIYIRVLGEDPRNITIG